MNNLLSLEEVKSFLQVEEQDVHQLMDKGKLQAYKIGGAYLRFRKEEVLNIKQELHTTKGSVLRTPWFVRLIDFWRFNNFYILSTLLIVALFLFLAQS